jgi:hypothetical protein
MSAKDDDNGDASLSPTVGKGHGANGVAVAKRTRDAGLIVARSKQSYISEIFTLPRDQWEAKLVEYARKEHDEAAGRARAQIRRILDGD